MSALKWGLLAVFVGGGLLLGIWLVDVLGFDEGVVPAIALAMGGAALMIYYLIASRKHQGHDEIHVEL